jgi:hypothetical protein
VWLNGEIFRDLKRASMRNSELPFHPATESVPLRSGTFPAPPFRCRVSKTGPTLLLLARKQLR